MEIYLIRHTETTLGKGFCYGHSNIALQQPFLQTFDKIVNKLKFHKPILYTSPLKRCKQLANHFRMNNETIEEIYFDDRLKEINFGNWESKEWNNIDRNDLAEWMADFVNYKIPNGESFIGLYNRVNSFINNELLAKNYKTPVIIITHAGVIRSFLCKILGHPLKNAFKISIDYSSVTKLNIDSDDSYNNIGFINKVIK